MVKQVGARRMLLLHSNNRSAEVQQVKSGQGKSVPEPDTNRGGRCEDFHSPKNMGRAPPVGVLSSALGAGGDMISST